MGAVYDKLKIVFMCGYSAEQEQFESFETQQPAIVFEQLSPSQASHHGEEQLQIDSSETQQPTTASEMAASHTFSRSLTVPMPL